MKIVFFGLIGQGTVCLEYLISSGFDICMVVTEPAEPNASIRLKLSNAENLMKPSLLEYMKYNRIKEVCDKHRIPYIEVANRAELLNLSGSLKAANAETLVVSTFVFKIPREILSIFKYALNVHPSLLPQYRGPSPVMWALYNNEPVTGVSVHQMTEEYDAGDIYGQVKIQILPEDTGASLNRKIFEFYAPELLARVVADIQLNKFNIITQNKNEISYYGKYMLTDSQIDFESMTASRICAVVRAGCHYYPAHFNFNNETVIVWAAEFIDKNYDAAPGEAVEITENKGLVIQTAEKAVNIKLIQKNLPSDAQLMLGSQLVELMR